MMGTIMRTLFLFILLASCQLFEIEERLLIDYTSDDGEKVNIYFIQAGATANDVIQVRIKKGHEQERVIQSFEHNYLQGSRLINDSILQLILNDTGYYYDSNKADTVLLPFK